RDARLRGDARCSLDRVHPLFARRALERDRRRDRARPEGQRVRANQRRLERARDPQELGQRRRRRDRPGSDRREPPLAALSFRGSDVLTAPTMRRRVWCETVELPDVLEPRVLTMLAQRRLELLLSIRPGDIGGVAHAARACTDSGVPLAIWP